MKLGLNGTAVLALAGLAAGGLLLWKYGGSLKGMFTGDNALTRNATDADGNKVTAYQGAGPLGTLGAAANAASGGWFASLGQWVGDKAAELYDPNTQAANASLQSSTTRYNQAGTADSSGNTDPLDFYGAGIY